MTLCLLFRGWLKRNISFCLQFFKIFVIEELPCDPEILRDLVDNPPVCVCVFMWIYLGGRLDAVLWCSAYPLSVQSSWPPIENGFIMLNWGDWHNRVIGGCPLDGWACVCVTVCVDTNVCVPIWIHVAPSHSPLVLCLLVWIRFRLICGQWKQAAPIAVLCWFVIYLC